MHPYLPHLLSDIAAGRRTEPEQEEVYSKTFEEEMEEIEKWVAGEVPEYPFGYFCGLRPVQFPPSNQLTNDDMLLVCDSFSEMMLTWNLDATFPEELPIAFMYDILVKFLDEKISIPDSGFMTYDFCNSYPPDCVFKEYCSCLEIWNEGVDDMDDIAPPAPGDLPF